MKIKVGGINVKYEIIDEGRWLTLTHLLAWDLRMWADFASELGRKFKVLRFDRCGYGGTDLTPDPSTWCNSPTTRTFQAPGNHTRF